MGKISCRKRETACSWSYSFKLLDEDQTPNLFEDYDKIKSLNKAVDGLNKNTDLHPYYNLTFARKSAPMRIAFTQIPDLEIEDDEKEF